MKLNLAASIALLLLAGCGNHEGNGGQVVAEFTQLVLVNGDVIECPKGKLFLLHRREHLPMVIEQVGPDGECLGYINWDHVVLATGPGDVSGLVGDLR